jgi:hypothetical protein
MSAEPPDEFDQQFAALCAGFNKPCTVERRVAYRKSLGRLPAVSWARLVEHCLSEQGPDELPTTKRCWLIYRELRAPRPVYVHEQLELPEARDPWRAVANRHLLQHITSQVARDQLHERVAVLTGAKNQWAQEMREGGSAEHEPAYQERFWRELMVGAETRIDAMIAEATT